tara:strand:+ start:176 stop:1327 length:1152 start_codon:yes stop_codon:yes gene_type:complete
MSEACIYFIRNQSWPDLVKIGKTINLITRLKTHNKEGSSFPFHWTVEAVISCSRDEYSALERDIHQHFKEFRANRKEFFKISPKEVKQYLDECIAPGTKYAISYSVEEYLYGDLENAPLPGGFNISSTPTRSSTNQALTRPGRPRGQAKTTPLSDDEVYRLFQSCNGKYQWRNRAIIACGLYFGLPNRAARCLTLDQILDSDNKCRTSILSPSNAAKMSQSIDRFFTGKEGRGIIDEYVSRIDGGKDYLADRNNLLFPSPKVKQQNPQVPMSQSAFSTLVVNQCKKAGILNKSWNSFRKTFAYKMAHSGLAIEQIASVLQVNNISALEEELSTILDINNPIFLANAIDNVQYEGIRRKEKISAVLEHIDITKMRQQNKIIFFT